MIPIIGLGHGMKAAKRRGGGSKPGCTHRPSKLRTPEARARLMSLRGTMIARKAAEQFGVSVTTVTRAWAGTQWKLPHA